MNLTKLILTSVTALLINQNAIAADGTYFDLHAQDFSEAKKDGEMIWARYELLESYVTTNLKHTSTYSTLNDTGFFKVELKQPLVTWGITVDMSYGFYFTSHKRSIILTADSGASLIISLSGGGVYFNGEEVYDPVDHERLSISVNRNSAGETTLNINGQSVTTIGGLEFPRLRSVEAQLIVESNTGNDSLNNLTISGDQGL